MILRRRVLASGIKIEIRQAKTSDADVIADYNLRMALETERRQLDAERVGKGVQALLDDPAKGVYYVAETGPDGAALVTASRDGTARPT